MVEMPTLYYRPGHRHDVAGGEAVEHAKQLSPVGPCARHFLAEGVAVRASGGAELLKLGVKRLTDAGVTETAFFGLNFGHILTANVTH